MGAWGTRAHEANGHMTTWGALGAWTQGAHAALLSSAGCKERVGPKEQGNHIWTQEVRVCKYPRKPEGLASLTRHGSTQ